MCPTRQGSETFSPLKLVIAGTSTNLQCQIANSSQSCVDTIDTASIGEGNVINFVAQSNQLFAADLSLSCGFTGLYAPVATVTPTPTVYGYPYSDWHLNSHLYPDTYSSSPPPCRPSNRSHWCGRCPHEVRRTTWCYQSLLHWSSWCNRNSHTFPHSNYITHPDWCDPLHQQPRQPLPQRPLRLLPQQAQLPRWM